MWVSPAQISGKQMALVGSSCSNFDVAIEWKLRKQLFQNVSIIIGNPTLGLFAPLPRTPS